MLVQAREEYLLGEKRAGCGGGVEIYIVNKSAWLFSNLLQTGSLWPLRRSTIYSREDGVSRDKGIFAEVRYRRPIVKDP